MKSTSKSVRARIKDYIRENYDPSGYDLEPTTSLPEIAHNILTTMRREMNGRTWIKNDEKLFVEWCSCLPSMLCCDDFELGGYEIIELLADWLEETPEQAAKYSIEQATEHTAHLIYRELSKEEAKYNNKIV